MPPSKPPRVEANMSLSAQAFTGKGVADGSVRAMLQLEKQRHTHVPEQVGGQHEDLHDAIVSRSLAGVTSVTNQIVTLVLLLILLN